MAQGEGDQLWTNLRDVIYEFPLFRSPLVTKGGTILATSFVKGPFNHHNFFLQDQAANDCWQVARKNEEGTFSDKNSLSKKPNDSSLNDSCNSPSSNLPSMGNNDLLNADDEMALRCEVKY